MKSRRQRVDDLPKSKRTFVTASAPYVAPAKPDTTIPMMGQRKRKRRRRLKLNPIPLQVD